MRLAGRKALVTGAARGIGRAIAERYAAEGAGVVGLDIAWPEGEAAGPEHAPTKAHHVERQRSPEAARKRPPGGETGPWPLRGRVSLSNAGAARADARVGPRVELDSDRTGVALELDITDPAAAAAGVAEAVARLGGLDLVVNAAAARTPAADITVLEPAEWERAFAVNVTGMFLVCRAALPEMRRAGRGTIINIASQLGRVGLPGAAAYCATKGAVLQFTRALALDCAGDGIRVNSLSPGAVLGERLSASYGSDAAAEAALAPRHPLGRIGRAGEIAAAALFLAEEECGFLTGADLVVDGGYTAR